MTRKLTKEEKKQIAENYKNFSALETNDATPSLADIFPRWFAPTVIFLALIFFSYYIYSNFFQSHGYDFEQHQLELVQDAAPAIEEVVPDAEHEYAPQPEVIEPPRKSPEQIIRDAWAEADRINAAVDKAQNDLLDDFRSRAVKRYVANGAGNVMVETFVMPDGETVMCTTIVGNMGKSVDCE